MEVSLSWLYIVGANVDDRRKVIDKGKWKNDQRERVSTCRKTMFYRQSLESFLAWKKQWAMFRERL